MEIAIDNAAFMDEFFCQVSVTISASVCGGDVILSDFFVILYISYAFQIEDIRNSIDKIDSNVAEVKKLYSVILSAPTSDQSKMSPTTASFPSCTSPLFSFIHTLLTYVLYLWCFSDLTSTFTIVIPL